jgi:hypothetical protein
MPESVKGGRFYRKKWLPELIALDPGNLTERLGEDGVWLCSAELGHVSRKIGGQRVHTLLLGLRAIRVPHEVPTNVRWKTS